MHHAHLIVPMAATEEACMNDTARFVLSHGATFFCPHTWDVRLLAQIVEDDARAMLCVSFLRWPTANRRNTLSDQPSHKVACPQKRWVS